MAYWPVVAGLAGALAGTGKAIKKKYPPKEKKDPKVNRSRVKKQRDR
jgi:hypothetical protein